MSEIEKMYENAGVKPEINYVCDKEPCEQHSVDCQKCSHLYDTREDYPDFTAEKQLELIKLLMKQEDFSWTVAQQGKDTKYVFYVGYEYGSGDFKEFTEALAGIINDLWAMKYLTSEEKQQVKGILE